jgi:hypothetical protein
MKRDRLFPLAVLLFAAPLVFVTASHAQRAARSSSPIRAVATTHRGATTMASPLRSRRNSPTQGGVFNNGFSNGLGNVNFFAPNALGPNGINLVTNQDIGIEAAIDPATQLRLATASRFGRGSTGFFPGGYYFLDGGGAYALPQDYAEGDQSAQQQQPQQQQPIVMMQAPAQQQAPEANEQSLPDAGQFTLVLRDGSQIEAIAFTHMKDRIIYITREGTRRTLAFNDLDTDATIRLNQERGTPLQLPL